MPPSLLHLRFMGRNYVESMCDKFIEEDRWLKNFAYELPVVIKYTLNCFLG